MRRGDEDGRVRVEVWLNDYPVVPDFLRETADLAARFSDEHPGVEIAIRGIQHVDLPTELAGAAAAGRPPALVQQFYTSTQLARDLVDRDGAALFVPVERAVAGRDRVLGEPVRLHEIVRAAREYYSVDGELLAVPPLTSTLLLYANRDLLRDAGWTRPPSTWSEVEQVSDAVRALPGGPTHGITWPNHGWIQQQVMASAGGLLATPHNGRAGRATTVELCAPELLAFARWWSGQHAAGRYLSTGVRSAGADTWTAWLRNADAFASGRVSMVLSTSVEAGRLVTLGAENGFDVDVAPMPRGPKYAGNVVGGDALWLTAGLDPATRDAALAFLMYLMRPEHVADRHRTSGFIPVTRAAVDLLDREGWFERHPYHRAALAQLAGGDGSPAARGALVGDFARVQDLLTRAMDEVLRGELDVGEAYAKASAEAQGLLDGYVAHCLTSGPAPHHFRVG